MGRIDPVEYVSVSQQRNGNVRNIIHPLCGCAKSPFRYNRGVQATIKERKGDFMAKQTNSLAHTKWMCKYHIVFAPKYGRKVFYNEKKEAIREIIWTLCQRTGIEIIEGEVCPDHIHLLLSIPPKMNVSGFIGYLKGKRCLTIFDRFGNMKFACWNRKFCYKGYYVDTVGKNTVVIKSYIANQLKQNKKID